MDEETFVQGYAEVVKLVQATIPDEVTLTHVRGQATYAKFNLRDETSPKAWVELIIFYRNGEWFYDLDWVDASYSLTLADVVAQADLMVILYEVLGSFVRRFNALPMFGGIKNG